MEIGMMRLRTRKVLTKSGRILKCAYISPAPLYWLNIPEPRRVFNTFFKIHRHVWLVFRLNFLDCLFHVPQLKSGAVRRVSGYSLQKSGSGTSPSKTVTLWHRIELQRVSIYYCRRWTRVRDRRQSSVQREERKKHIEARALISKTVDNIIITLNNLIQTIREAFLENSAAGRS